MNIQSTPPVRRGDVQRRQERSPSRRALLAWAGVTLLGGITGVNAVCKDPLHDQAVEVMIRSHRPPQRGTGSAALED